MPLFSTPSSRAHKTTLLINEEDWKFIKQRGFKPTNLLRKKISELRNREQGNATDWEKSAERFRVKLENLCEQLGAVLTKEQFKAIMEKI